MSFDVNVALEAVGALDAVAHRHFHYHYIPNQLPQLQSNHRSHLSHHRH